MKKSAFTIGRIVTAAAFVLALTPLAQAHDTIDQLVTVHGIALQGPAGPSRGHRIGPNFLVERTLELGIWPCSTTEFPAFLVCLSDTNGFFGKVVVNPERVLRLDNNGAWSYQMVAIQRIVGGSVDYSAVPGFEWLGKQDFPTASIVADGVTYKGCKIKQTLVATGDLVQTGDITTSFAANVFASWTVDLGSTCRAPSGRVVKVIGFGSLTFDPDPTSPTFTPVPTYDGTIRIFR